LPKHQTQGTKNAWADEGGSAAFFENFKPNELGLVRPSYLNLQIMSSVLSNPRNRNQWSQHQMTSLARTLKAMAHPVRLSILDMLDGGKKLTVTEIYTRLGADQSAVSHHLSLLKDRGVLVAEREGKFIRYQLRHPEYLTLIDCLVSNQLMLNGQLQASKRKG
jgi:DNA-binding transcriptional ArsR family regulator